MSNEIKEISWMLEQKLRSGDATALERAAFNLLLSHGQLTELERKLIAALQDRQPA